MSEISETPVQDVKPDGPDDQRHDADADEEVVELPDRPILPPRAQLIAMSDIQELENMRRPTPGSIDRMAGSIRVRGLLHPVLVRPAHDPSHGRPYELIVGYRRFAAFQQLGYDKIPAVIHDATDEEVLAEMITENGEREDHTPIDEARTMQRMIDVFGWTHAQVAAHLNKDRSQVTKSLGLLKLPDKVVEMVEEGKLTRSHAEVISSLGKPEEQEEVAELAARTETPVSKLTNYVRKIKEEQQATPESTIEVLDAGTPLSVLEPQEVTPLPRLELREDLTAAELAKANLYILLRAGNDLEMLEYLEANYNADWDALWDFVSALTDEQVAEMTETMVRRWLIAAHRYPTLPAELRDELGAGETMEGPQPPELSEDVPPVGDEGEFDEDFDYEGEFLDEDEF